MLQRRDFTSFYNRPPCLGEPCLVRIIETPILIRKDSIFDLDMQLMILYVYFISRTRFFRSNLSDIYPTNDKGGSSMKKLLVILLLGLFLAGCGQSLRESEFYDHGSHYKNFDHLAFSWFGYKNVTDQHVEQSKNQPWWGIEIDQTGR